jgi:hypothetical protein
LLIYKKINGGKIKMVKSKKMSKTSIAVIVLAILLVLSLCLGITGAWFTDKDSGANEKALTFGLVKIGIDDADDTENGQQYIKFEAAEGSFENNLVLPGDVYNFNGSITNESTVDTYVLVTFTAYMEDASGNRYKVYATQSQSDTTELLEIDITGNDVGYTLGAQWAAVNETNESITYTKAGQKLFLVQQVSNTAADNTLAMEGKVTLAGETFKNSVYLQEVDTYGDPVMVGEPAAAKARTQVQMNGNSSYKLVVNVAVKAIQKNHLASAAAAYALLDDADYVVEYVPQV